MAKEGEKDIVECMKNTQSYVHLLIRNSSLKCNCQNLSGSTRGLEWKDGGK